MAIDGVNSQQDVKSVLIAKVSANANAEASAKANAQALQSALNGADRNQQEIQNERMTPNERKAWIRDYQNAYGCSKKEAKAAFEKEFGKLDKMSHKEAKQWVKAQMETTGCNKKEAKEAFKQEFGYDMPLSLGAKIVRTAMFASGIGAYAEIADTIAGGKLGVNKFVTGQGNNDAKYERRT